MKEYFHLLMSIIAGLVLSACQFEASDSGQNSTPPTPPAVLPFRNPNLPLDKRINDLLSRLTLKEKASMMTAQSEAVPRLGIPRYHYWNECLHGVARAGNATVFPQAIGMAATWDTGLINKVADTISTEARAKYHEAIRQGKRDRYRGLTFWTPNINIFRDPRWGRGQETYGEDPFLTGELGVAFIKGLQGSDPKYYKVLACAKHYAVHSGPEPLRHVFNISPSKSDLYDTYLPQFEKAVKEGKVGSIMGAYNSIYGVPCCASSFLLQDILRNKWGFKGHVVSDCGAIRDIFQNHKFTKTPEEATAAAIKAGCDLNCGSIYSKYIVHAVNKGLLSEKDVNRALSRLLETRFRLGMFDPPEMVPYSSIPYSANNTADNRKLALLTAEESLVLLKNDGTLPLAAEKLKTVAVIGPNAKPYEVLLGNYHGTSPRYVTIYQGIRNFCRGKAKVVTTPGTPLLKSMWDAEKLKKEEQEALKIAKSADVIIFAGGINSHLEGEEMKNVKYPGFKGGDRITIELPEVQVSLLKKLKTLNKPLIYVNCSGSAIAMPWIADNVSAIIQAWYPGEEGGTAVANVIFGKYNPAGRLPVTFYASTKDVMPFNDYSMKNRTYRYFNGQPLYAFGFGMSYSNFEYTKAVVAKNTISRNGRVKVDVAVKNSSSLPGEEVVQVYIKIPEKKGSTIPVKALCAFKRVMIPASQEKTVSFDIPADRFRLWNDKENDYIIAKGEYILEIGAASDDIKKRVSITIE